MHEDARMCLSIALTAARLGASVANHVEVIELLKSTESETGATVVSGARVRDTQTGSCLGRGRKQYRMGSLGTVVHLRLTETDSGLGIYFYHVIAQLCLF